MPGRERRNRLSEDFKSIRKRLEAIEQSTSKSSDRSASHVLADLRQFLQNSSAKLRQATGWTKEQTGRLKQNVLIQDELDRLMQQTDDQDQEPSA